MRSSIILLAVLIVTVFACTPGTPEYDEQASLEKGQEIASAAFQALSGRLQHAMQEGGPVHAVDYCSLNALLLVDSISREHGARVRRTSDRTRAEHDNPDVEESEVLSAILDAWESAGGSGAIAPRVKVHKDSIAYYQAIHITSPACLKCHGIENSTLDSAAHVLIKERYPNDRATGYSLGDLRGMWSVRWAR